MAKTTGPQPIRMREFRRAIDLLGDHKYGETRGRTGFEKENQQGNVLPGKIRSARQKYKVDPNFALTPTLSTPQFLVFELP